MLAGSGAFQYLAILHEDRVTGHARREARLRPADRGALLGQRGRPRGDAHGAPVGQTAGVGSPRITGAVPGVVSVTYNIATKPPSTIEAV